MSKYNPLKFSLVMRIMTAGSCKRGEGVAAAYGLDITPPNNLEWD
jgi:hypothetical protein